MVSKENQEVLNWFQEQICAEKSDFCKKNKCCPKECNECIETKYYKTLQQAIDDLELYKKAFDDILDSMEQEKVICLYHGCPAQVEDDNFECIGTCPTRQEITDYFLNLARKELENGK